MAYPIATLANGNILYSDGTSRPNTSIASTPQLASFAPASYIRTPSPAQPVTQTNSVQSYQAPVSQENNYDNSAILNQYNAQLGAFNQASDNYINSLLDIAGQDRDTAIKILTREHEQALGNNDSQRAQFLESVSDELEKRIGTIPYDYQIGTQRTNEDIARSTELVNRNKESALKRLAEDEMTWKNDYAKSADVARTNQQEDLLRRGLLQGKRSDIQGVGSYDVNNLETDLSNTLAAYNRALGRSREDVNQQAEDSLFDINRTGQRTLSDLKTQARRAAGSATDSYSDNTAAANTAYERAQKELERQRELEKLANQTRAKATLYG